MALIRGRTYIYLPLGKKLEFGYMGQTGLAIAYEPGECNMQDAWAVNPAELVTPLEYEAMGIIKLAKHCKISLEQCIEDLQDTRGWCFDLTDKIRELWNSPVLPREQGEQL